jgi:diguanylate cyclase (GGDEF)-like protein
MKEYPMISIDSLLLPHFVDESMVAAVYDANGKLISSQVSTVFEVPPEITFSQENQVNVEALENLLSPFVVRILEVEFEGKASWLVLAKERTVNKINYDFLPVGVMTLDESYQINSCNQFVQLILGLDEIELKEFGLEAIMGADIFQASLAHFSDIYATDSFKSRIQFTSPIGRGLILSLCITRVRTIDFVDSFFVVIQDVTDEMNSRKRVEYLASHDAMTNVLNRNSLLSQLEKAIQNRRILNAALLYIDVNKFKAINDKYGHSVGDKSLIHVANTIKKQIRKSDLVARMGGDEFVVVLFDVKNQKQLEMISTKLKESVAKGVVFEGQLIEVHIAMGVSTWQMFSAFMQPSQIHKLRPKDIIDKWLQETDEIMYQSKKSDDNAVIFFTKDVEKEVFVVTKFNWLKKLIQKQNYYFQKEFFGDPCNQTLELNIVSELPFNRWQINLVDVNDFLERSLREKLIRSIFIAIMRYLKTSQNSFLLKANVTISFNLQHSFLQNENAVDILTQVAQKYSVPANRICVKFDETFYCLHRSVLQTQIAQLKSQGFKLGLSGYGEYSNMMVLIDEDFDSVWLSPSLIHYEENSYQAFMNLLLNIASEHNFNVMLPQMLNDVGSHDRLFHQFFEHDLD